MESCLVCDYMVIKAHTRIQGYPLCSQECADEWNNLTYLEKVRYLEYVAYILSEAYD